MSILIKGMAMPQKCFDCKLCAFIPIGVDGLMTKCLPLNRATDVAKLRPDCPLVAVPDHGDLIDRDALMAHKGSAYDIDGHELYAVGTGTILRMPVVIPAERSEE